MTLPYCVDRPGQLNITQLIKLSNVFNKLKMEHAMWNHVLDTLNHLIFALDYVVVKTQTKCLARVEAS